MAMLFVSGQFNCGGTLVASKYIVTAAHCVTYLNTITIIPSSLITVRESLA